MKVPETAIPVGCSLSEIKNIVDPLEYGIDFYLKHLDIISHSSSPL